MAEAANAANKTILIVTGDFGVIQRVRGALWSDDIAVQTAFSHADGLYAAQSGQFDAVLVEADMTDHRTGEYTLIALARAEEGVPVIGLVSNGSSSRMHLPANVQTSPLDETAIWRSLSVALGLSPAAPEVEEAAEVEDESSSSSSLQALFTLSKSLTEVLDLTEVLNRVVEAARRLTSAEEGMILLPDEEGGQLYLRAKVGIDVEVARNFRIKTQDTLAGHVFSTGQPVLIGAQGPQKVKTEYLVNALLYVPILYKGECIGVLGVNNKNTDRVFEPTHQELLSNLASFAAIAIENARIHEEALARNRELQTLVEASQAVNASLSLEQTLPSVCEQLVRVANVSRAQIFEWHPEGSQLRIQAQYFRAVWAAGQGPSIELAKRPTLEAALDMCRPLLIRRADAATSAADVDYLNQIGAAVWQIVPIVGGSQTLGTVQAFYTRMPEQTLDADTLNRVQHMALEVLVALSSQTNATRVQGLFRVIEDINRLTRADWSELALLLPDRRSLVVHAAVGYGVWLRPPQPFLDTARYPDLAEAVRMGTLIQKQSDSKIMSPGLRALLDMSSSRSVLVLPLSQRDRANRLVVLADTRRRSFSQRDIDLTRTLVAQAATALDNAHLLHDLEKSLRDLRDTQDRLVQTARLSAMGELAAAVAHQINNPLTTIMVDSEMLLLDEKPDSPNYQSLLAISRAGKRAAGVARRLLAIARPNDPEAPPQPVDVVDTIEGVLSLVKSRIERDHIQIVTDLPADRLPSVWTVPGQLDDIWLNLVMNAHDALMGQKDARIAISAGFSPDRNAIDVVVADNGPGIPADIVDHIFKPFFTTKPVGEGTGLGLHICRQAAERAGGRISVTSVPGEGTRFLVRLPIKKGTEAL